MDQSRLHEIKDRFENTTYGHWKVYKKEEGTFIGTSDDHAQLRSPAPVVTLSYNVKEPHHSVWISDNNAEFIAHSKEDIEWLIEQAERLTILEQQLQDYQDEIDPDKIANIRDSAYEAYEEISKNEEIRIEVDVEKMLKIKNENLIEDGDIVNIVHEEEGIKIKGRVSSLKPNGDFTLTTI